MFRTSKDRWSVVALAMITFGAACRGADASKQASKSMVDSVRVDSIARARQDSINRAQPGYVIDSILPLDEQIRRFEQRVGGSPVTALAQVASSRDELVQRFMAAVKVGDSTSLRALAVTPREFIDLVYPESPNTAPPYQQDPALVWQTIQNPSQSGFVRLLRRVSGAPTALSSYQCDSPPARQGRNLLWGNCQLELVGKAGTKERHRLFGTIIERDGRFKILSFRNEF